MGMDIESIQAACSRRTWQGKPDDRTAINFFLPAAAKRLVLKTTAEKN